MPPWEAESLKSIAEILDKDIRKIFWSYLIPSVGGMLGISLYVLGDTMIVGRGLGSQGLAALNISIPLINVFAGFGLLLGIGGATALSVSRGRGKGKKLNLIFTKSIVMSLVVGVALTLIRIFFLEKLCYFLGASEATLEMAKAYLGVLMSFSIPFLLNTTLTIFVRNDGAPELAMWSMLTGSILNVVLDYVFIFIFGWGMAGGALAIGLAPLTGLLILSTHFLRKQNTIKLVRLQLRPKIIGRIIANGGASFIIELSAGIVIFAFNRVILGLAGDLGVSAYSIVANLSLICAAIFAGIGQGVQPIVSVNYGAGKTERIYEAASLGLYVASGLGLVFYLIGLAFPEYLVSLFTGANTELMSVAVNGIRLYFLSFVVMGLNIVLTSFLQSKEQSRVSLFISLTRGLGLILICLAVLPKFMGLNGVWLTMPIAEGITLLLAVIISATAKDAVEHSIMTRPLVMRLRRFFG